MEVGYHSSDSNDSNGRSDSGMRSHPKRSKLGDGEVNQSIDFISNLPNTLLLDILSLLPVKHVVSTTILSKRWQGLWTYTPVLNICLFDGQRKNYFMNYRDIKRFISTVNYTLLLYQSPNIQKFNILMKYVPSFSHDIDAWLLFALRKNVQELQLYLEDWSPYDDVDYDDDDDADDDDCGLYELPPFLLKSSSLVTLKISKCQFEGHRLIKWKSLKVLVLKIMSLTNNLIQDIFSGCPSLESLELSCCNQFDYIESKNLQNLVISSYNYFGSSEGVLRISAPSLRSLEISRDMRAQRLSLINSSVSLVKANICFCLDSDDQTLEISGQMFTKNLRGILEKLCHVKYLTVGSWCLQVLSLVEDVIAPFSNLVCLTLQTPLSPCDRPGITRLLVSTPLVDTLIIDIDAVGSSSWLEFLEEFHKSKAVNARDYWVSQKGFIEETLGNLRTVKIVGFKGSEDEMEFIAFMLNNAEHLEKMIIQRRKPARYLDGGSDSMCIAERLLSFPRCSSTAVILFYEIPEKTYYQ